MADELLVYDLRSQQVTALNTFAASVWKAWNGGRTAAEIASVLASQGLWAEIEAIDKTLAMLAKSKLIETLKAEPLVTDKMFQAARRGFLRSWAKGAVATAATPSVVTIVAPQPAQAASLPCGVVCSGAKPYCSSVTKTCVQCIINSECTVKTAPICTSFKCGTGGVL